MAQNEAPVFDESLLELAENDETVVGADFDPDADYSQPPPPLPDGWYQAKPILLGVKKDGSSALFEGPRAWGNIPATYFTQVQFQIVDPGGPQDGKQTARFNVTTHPEERRHNASSASLLYRALTDKPLPGLKQGAHMASVVKELQNPPLVWIKTQLEGEAADAGRAYNDSKKAGTLQQTGLKKPKTWRGEKSFSENGKVTGRVFDSASNEYVVGRPAVQDIKPLSFTPPSK